METLNSQQLNGDNKKLVVDVSDGENIPEALSSPSSDRSASPISRKTQTRRWEVAEEDEARKLRRSAIYWGKSKLRRSASWWAKSKTWTERS